MTAVSPPGPLLGAPAAGHGVSNLLLGSPLVGTTDDGWLYTLLVKAGVSPSDAHSVVNFVLRPLWIVLVLVIAFIVARLGVRFIRRLLGRMAQHAADRSSSTRANARATTMVALLASLWRFFVYVVAFLIILGMLGINLTPLLASATVIGATIGFGAQSLVRDYLSGFLLTMEDQFGIGDTISVNDTTGVVEDLSLRVTRVRAADGTVWYLPNGDIRRLANNSRGWAKAVVDLPVKATSTAELNRAKDLVADAARTVAHGPRFASSCTEPPEVLGLVAAAAEGATLRVALRTSPGLRDPLARALREAAVDALVGADLWPDAATPA